MEWEHWRALSGTVGRPDSELDRTPLAVTLMGYRGHRQRQGTSERWLLR